VNGSSADTLGARYLRELGREPRPAGSDSAAVARRYCADVLSALGYEPVERPFDYSAAVGQYGTSVGGLVAFLVLAVALGTQSRLILFAGAVLIVLAGRWLGRHGVLRLSMLRRRGVNLEARRGVEPVLWLVAHIDSKSQPIPLLVRAAGIVLLVIGWIGALFFMHGWPYVGLVGALPVIASVVGRGSAGSVDNASGVATVLSAASILPTDAPVGILITDAEELGLAGARAWCAIRSAAIVLNCDGVDDDGELTLMWTRPRARRVERAFGALRVIPLVPGVLVDSLAFSDAGWEAVTLSRGTLRTLRRIHTRHDSLDHLRGDGIAGAARALATAALTLTERR